MGRASRRRVEKSKGHATSTDQVRVELATGDQSKVRAIMVQVQAGKVALADLELRYEVERAKILGALAELEKRGTSIVTEAAESLGVAAGTRFDWTSLAFVRPT